MFICTNIPLYSPQNMPSSCNDKYDKYISLLCHKWRSMVWSMKSHKKWFNKQIEWSYFLEMSMHSQIVGNPRTRVIVYLFEFQKKMNKFFYCRFGKCDWRYQEENAIKVVTTHHKYVFGWNILSSFQAFTIFPLPAFIIFNKNEEYSLAFDWR